MPAAGCCCVRGRWATSLAASGHCDGFTPSRLAAPLRRPPRACRGVESLRGCACGRESAAWPAVGRGGGLPCAAGRGSHAGPIGALAATRRAAWSARRLGRAPWPCRPGALVARCGG
eukprot:4634455-Alexandrium_andersonii.AAC.1